MIASLQWPDFEDGTLLVKGNIMADEYESGVSAILNYSLGGVGDGVYRSLHQQNCPDPDL